MAQVQFDDFYGAQFLRYAKLLAGRGYVHNTLGNMAIRALADGYPHGVAYTKHAEVSLEEMTSDNIVITDIPSSQIVYGNAVTSVGHNLSRKILELRSDVNAVIHVHDDHTIAFFASGAFEAVGTVSLDFPFIHGKPPYYLPADVDVEADAARIESFIADTNCLVLLGHGVTTVGRNISEAYHRLNAFTSEVRRNILAEQLAAAKGTTVRYRTQAEINDMYRLAEQIIYPDRAEGLMHGDSAAD
ncbi:MAG: class II aldolase/adducin family protein [Gammaproteobacteria bacterium]|nr:class II aldolase/adducin family protein [Gammaproteobacteria bacterium]